MPARQVWTKFSVPRYVKLTLPHAALILLCLVYITMGAFVFFSIESPHEIALKKAYCQRIRETTMDYIDVLWSNRRQSTVTETRKQWQTQLNRGLLNITNVLYAAFVTDYISYSLIDLNQTDGLSKALENSWTLKSSLFFSTTTIVTIGYGNIVPATAHGRLLCILFALFGCPLAIITVGDLGKFLSEFVVHCYNKTQKIKKALMQRVTEWPTFPAKIILNCDSDVLSLHYEDLILGEENISASVVISIFLTYNTIGALIFKITEGWSFMDSFYFCFISITTVGFGDFVPKHDPWHIMVTCYTAVGIGITTMCIDLVGTRYITKLHYFGRKLRGGDLMRYLRRKRIRDSKILLAARAAETIEAYLKNFDRSGREESALMILSEPEFIDKGGHDTIEKTEIALTINLPVTVQHAEKVINKNFVCSMHSIQGDLEVRHESSILGNTHAKDRENTYTMQLFPLVPLTDSGSKSSLSSVRDSCESPNDQLKREMIRNYALAQLAGLPSGTAAKSLPNILPLLPM